MTEPTLASLEPCFRSLQILGNGPGRVPPLDEETPLVVFNTPSGRKVNRRDIQVLNAKHAGDMDNGRQFVVRTETFDDLWRQRFVALLEDSASVLKAAIRCEPTTGLTALYSALQLATQINAYRMPLRPCLLRAHDMSNRQPLPCAFHNWLGERNVALLIQKQWGRGRLSWASLPLQETGVFSTNVPRTNPLLALLYLFTKYEKDREDDFVEGIEVLANVEMRLWYQYADVTSLRRLEPFFFLDRHAQETKRWWLYSNRSSAYLDTILCRLMLCQQYLQSR
jgi:hypothetical protein